MSSLPSESTRPAANVDKSSLVESDARRFPVWHLPPLDLDEAARKRVYQDEYQNGYDDGFTAGRDAGLSAASAEAGEATLRFSAVMNSVNQSLKANDSKIAGQLAELAGAIAEAVVRAELSIRPEHMLELLQHLVNQLPGNHEQIELRLNPLDADLVSKRMETLKLMTGANWQVTADAELDPGDCVLVTRESLLDASVTEQIAAIVTELMEDSR